MNRVAPGYNHDIPYRGIVYHVQTEFLRQPTPHVGTQIYCRGRIVEAETTMVGEGPNELAVDLSSMMTAQHRTMIRRLVSGQVRDEDATYSSPVPHPPPKGGGLTRGGDAEVRSLRRPSDAQRHLELRRSAIRVARAVRPEQPPPPELVRTRLSAIVSSMADIAIRHPYQQTRHEELAQLLMLRSEAIEWLRDPELPADRGLRLWRGFTRMCGPLEGVNGRKAVIDHDRQVWDLVRRRLSVLRDDQPVDRELLTTLRTTWGRYKALDELLDFCTSPRAEVLHTAIDSALQALEEECAEQSGEASERPPRPVE